MFVPYYLPCPFVLALPHSQPIQNPRTRLQPAAKEEHITIAKLTDDDKPVSFIKSEYNDYMTNVNWMNRNGYVVGAPAWKGGEDGVHCH